MFDLLRASGVTVETERLLWLRHLVRKDRTIPRVLTNLPGGFVVRRRGRGLEVDDIRVFAHGDDMRHLDRATTARTGVPHVRTFRDERERNILILTDFRPSMLWGTKRVFRSVAASEMAALAGWRAIELGGRVGLLAFGSADPVVVPARGRDRGMLAVIGGIASAHAHALQDPNRTDPPLSQAMELAARIAPKGASVLIMSSFENLGDDFEVMLGALQRRATVSAFILCDAFETAAPKGSYPYVKDGTTVEIGHIVTNKRTASDDRLSYLDRLGIDAALTQTASGPEGFVSILEAFDANIH